MRYITLVQVVERPPQGGAGHVGEEGSGIAPVESAEAVSMIHVFGDGHGQPRLAPVARLPGTWLS